MKVSQLINILENDYCDPTKYCVRYINESQDIDVNLDLRRINYLKERING